MISLPATTAVAPILGIAALAFGAVLLTSLSLRTEELLSVVWVLAFGLAGAVIAYARRPRTSPA